MNGYSYKIYKRNVLQAAINKFGKDQQLNMMIEECAELIQAINKYKRYGKIENVLEEIADVQIMIEQMQMIFFPSTTEKYEREKIDRLALLVFSGGK